MQGEDRQMVEGNWTCSGCGAAITQLPFAPSPDRMDALKCRDCFKKDRPQTSRSSDRPMVEGNWTCSGCGGSITQLPFQPREGSADLKCRDCFKSARA